MRTKPSNIKSPHYKELLQWHRNVDSCTKCEISKFCKHKVKTRRHAGSLTDPEIIIVGEAPGSAEYILGEPFVGPAGEELQDILKEALPDTPILLTNAILCTPFLTKERADIGEPSLSEITACGEHLHNLIKLYKPKHVVALGNIAHKALNLVSIPHLKVPHPSYIMQSKDRDYEFQKLVLNLKGLINGTVTY